MSTTANNKTTGNEIENNFAGIDVAKDELVLHLLDTKKKSEVVQSTVDNAGNVPVVSSILRRV